MPYERINSFSTRLRPHRLDSGPPPPGPHRARQTAPGPNAGPRSTCGPAPTSESTTLSPSVGDRTTMPRHVLILAAGRGTRMRSSTPKVLHRLAGLPLIEHVIRTAAQLSPVTTGVVVGHRAAQVQEGLADYAALRFATQSAQLGTGHALLQAAPMLQGCQGTLVVLSGDVPLVRAATLERLVVAHEGAAAAVTVGGRSARWSPGRSTGADRVRPARIPPRS